MLLGAGADMPLELGQQRVVVLDHGQIQGDGVTHLGIGEVRQQPFAIAALLDAAFQRRQVVLADRVLDVSDELGALAHEMTAPAQQIARGAHARGVDVGLGEHPTADQAGDLVRIDLVVLGLAPVYRAHVQGVAEHEGDALARTQIGQPVPGEHALHGHHQVIAEGLDHGQKRLRAALEVARHHYLAGRVHDAHVHLTGVQVDTTVVLVLTGIEFHLRPPFRLVSGPTPLGW
jgi:hypothetical protein